MDNLAAWLHGAVYAMTFSLFATGKGSRTIGAKEAQKLQMGAEHVDETLVWTVYGSPDKFVARPCMTVGGVTAMPVHLEAPTLEQLRELLPPGLTRSDPLPDDPPVVIETWQ